jgi:hypothetical protein
MAATSLLARLGLRLATLGSLASLAIAAPIAEGDVSQAAHTHAARTGWFFPTATSIGLVTNAAERVRFWADGGVQIGGAFVASPGAAGLLVQSVVGIVTRQAATQDAIALLGRAGGVGTFSTTLTTVALTGSRTITFPDASIVASGSAAALISGRVLFTTTGGLLTGSETLLYTGTSSLGINSAVAAERSLVFYTNAVQRWQIRCSSTAESGADSGSQFAISAYTDAGVFIDAPFVILRAAGAAITLARPVRCSGTMYAYTDGLVDAATVNYSALDSDNFTLLLTAAVGATRQLAVPTNLAAGMRWVVRVKQPAAGGPCNLTYPASYVFVNGYTPTLTTAANAVDLISCYYDGTSILTQIQQSYGLATSYGVYGSVLAITGSVNLSNRLVSANTVLDETYYTVAVDATAGNITITLPDTATTGVPGRVYNVKKVDVSANTVTIQRAGADLIDGAATQVLTVQYQSRTVHARTAGGAWDVI